MKIRRLRTKIILSFCLLLIGSGAMTASLVALNASSVLKSFKLGRAQRMAKVLAQQLAPAVESGDWATARFLVRTEAQHSNAYILLSARDREIFGTPRGIGKAPAALRRRRGSPATITLPEGQVINVPARLPRKLGWVHVGLSLERIRSTTTAIVRDVLLSTGLALVIGTIAVSVMASFITRPVQKLRDVTRRMGQGDLEAVASVSGSDELAELAATFNEMAAQIRDRIAQSEQLHAYFERVLDHMPSGVIVCDGNGKIEYANRAVRGLHGSLAGRLCKEAFPSERPCGRCQAESVLQAGRVLRTSHTSASGRDLDLTVVPMLAGATQPSVVTVLADVTEMKLLEQRLRRAERLAVAGEVSAGIVHAINNPLDGIRRALDLTRRSPQNPERMATMLELACEGTDRIARVTRTLLDFARADESQSRITVSPNEIVEEAAKLVMLRAEEAKVRIRLILEPDLPSLVVDPRAINDVVVNLLINGVDAASPGGQVTVTTRPGHGAIAIVVSDDGAGIQPEIMERIFEPFFTTKEIGRGTGLGLSMARRIVESYGGDISVQSAPTQGTFFTVHLPLPAGLASQAGN